MEISVLPFQILVETRSTNHEKKVTKEKKKKRKKWEMGAEWEMWKGERMKKREKRRVLEKLEDCQYRNYQTNIRMIKYSPCLQQSKNVSNVHSKQSSKSNGVRNINWKRERY